MTTTPLPGSPGAVEAYLADLERALSGAAPSARAEIVTLVREHIDERLAGLGHDPSAAEVGAVLRALGDPAQVAAEWSDGARGREPRDRPGASGAVAPGNPAAASAADAEGDARARGTAWALVILCFVAIFFSLLPIFGIIVGAGALVASILIYRSKLKDTRYAGMGMTAIAAGTIAALAGIAVTGGFVAMTPAGDGSVVSPASPVSVSSIEPAG